MDDVVEITLPSGGFAYGHVLEDPLTGFFSRRHLEPVPVAEAICFPYAFLVWVHHSAVESGRWPVIGKASLSIMPAPRFLKIDVIADAVSINRRGRGRVLDGRVSLADVETHEAAADWDAEHIEERLADLFAGRPNTQVQGLKERTRRAIQKRRET